MATGIVIAVFGAVLFFGSATNRQLAPRTGVNETVSFTAPAKVQAASVPAKPATLESLSPRAAASAAVTAASPIPAQAASTSDIDPHKAFGSKSAPITMEVFSDFQCPACKQLFKTTNQALTDNYVNTNKVYLVHRDFPLPMHAYSRVAAHYVRAAATLGKEELAEQVLFNNQEKWEQTGDIDGTMASVFSEAEMTKIRALAKGTSLDAAIEKDVALGKTYNVNQTPTTIIHFKGQTYPVVGVVTYDVLHQFLDQLLSQR
jgi:protein-disulfide isomerase